MLGLDLRLLAIAILCVVPFVPLEGFVAVMASYDSYILAFILSIFAALSAFGTKAVLSSGELPANDELFNLNEHLTPAQRSALRGGHVRDKFATTAS